jgi:N-acetylglucosamine transport system permease protein
MRKGRNTFAALFLLPAVSLYAVLFLWPVVQALGISFFEWSGLSDERKFVGLANFQTLFKDEIFRRSLLNNLTIIAGGGFFILCLAVLLAHALQGASRMARVLRSVYLLPHIVSMTIVAVLWKFVYHPTIGIATKVSTTVFGSSPVWLGDKKTALPAIILAFIWYGLGFYTMLFAAGIRSIPTEVMEAADLDGATGWRRFKLVTWPLLWSIKRMSIIHISIASMNIFALVRLMTEGGPDRQTEVMLTYLYEQAITNTDYGYATALATVNLVVVLLVAAAINWVFRRNPTEGAR